MQEALCIFSRASRSFPSATARGRNRNTRDTAFSHMASEKSL